MSTGLDSILTRRQASTALNSFRCSLFATICLSMTASQPVSVVRCQTRALPIPNGREFLVGQSDSLPADHDLSHLAHRHFRSDKFIKIMWDIHGSWREFREFDSSKPTKQRTFKRLFPPTTHNPPCVMSPRGFLRPNFSPPPNPIFEIVSSCHHDRHRRVSYTNSFPALIPYHDGRDAQLMMKT
jgi:hypothetical protein